MSDVVGNIRQQMGLRRTVGRLVDRSRRAMGIHPNATGRLELVISTIASRIGQPPVLVNEASVYIDEPAYCSVCVRPRGLSPLSRNRGLRPRLVQGFRCGFLLVLCDPCWRRIRKTGRVIDKVIETHREWHMVTSMARNIFESFEHGAGSMGVGGASN